MEKGIEVHGQEEVNELEATWNEFGKLEGNARSLMWRFGR